MLLFEKIPDLVGSNYCMIIGRNMGAKIIPIGALAGILWFKIVN